MHCDFHPHNGLTARVQTFTGFVSLDVASHNGEVTFYITNLEDALKLHTAAVDLITQVAKLEAEAQVAKLKAEKEQSLKDASDEISKAAENLTIEDFIGEGGATGSSEGFC